MGTTPTHELTVESQTADELKNLVTMLLQQLRAAISASPQDTHQLIQFEHALAEARRPEEVVTLTRDLGTMIEQIDAGTKAAEMRLAGAFRTAVDALVELLKSQLEGGGTVTQQLEQHTRQLEQLIDGGPSEDLLSHLRAIAGGVRGTVDRFRSQQKNAMAQLTTSQAEIERLKHELKRRQEEAVIDELTRIYNRRAFNKRLAEETARFKRYKEPFSLILFDIDRFKRFNDTYGHQAGDEVLETIADVVGKTIRSTDFLARYGGEEFAIIATGTPVERARVLAEKVRTKVADIQFVLAGDKLSVTISCGVADCTARDSHTSLVKRADACLYSAKAAGRNRVCQSNGS